MSIEIFRVLLILFRMKWRKRQRIQWEKNARVTLEIHVCIFVCDSNEQQSEKKWHKNELNDVKQWKEKKNRWKTEALKIKRLFRKKNKNYIYICIYIGRERGVILLNFWLWMFACVCTNVCVHERCVFVCISQCVLFFSFVKNFSYSHVNKSTKYRFKMRTRSRGRHLKKKMFCNCVCYDSIHNFHRHYRVLFVVAIYWYVTARAFHLYV